MLSWKSNPYYIFYVSIPVFTQNSKRIPHIILSSVVTPGVPHFPTLSLKWHNLKKKKLSKIKCTLILPTKFSIVFLILRWLQRDSVIYVHRHSFEVTLFSLDFTEIWIFWWISEKYSNMKFHENPCSGSRVISCGQTDKKIRLS